MHLWSVLAMTTHHGAYSWMYSMFKGVTFILSIQADHDGGVETKKFFFIVLNVSGE